ncbi:MAG: hypothetical protein N2606_02200 [Candidatus Omnitrophica bacterium]|nr:hypothetical protein [Candidatus Omnitrophota bacterium]
MFRVSVVFFVLIFSLLASGCHTIYHTSKGAVEGAKMDYEDAKKADDWIKKNLW